MTQGMTRLSAGQHSHLHRKWDDTAGNRRQTAESEIEHDVVNHFIKAKNKSGHKTVPWGTPDRTLTSREPCPSTRTRCVRLVGNSRIHVRVFPAIP